MVNNLFVIPRDDNVVLDIQFDDEGVFLETEKMERDHNFVSDKMRLSLEEMDFLCRKWMEFRNK